MILQQSIKEIFTHYATLVQNALREQIADAVSFSSKPPVSMREMETMYGHMRYHLGWVDVQFQPTEYNTGKLLRPTLLLLAYEAANDDILTSGGEGREHFFRALPAAVALELFHNFTLVHDDIEDGDVQRRHRPTVWSLWGIPFAINTGDAMNCLSRLALFKLLDRGVDADLVARLGCTFDRTALAVAEGQHLDLSFEKQEQISIPMYLDMITRKTARLMACATEIGAMLATEDPDRIERLQAFGLRLGIAFQMRDDLLGIWASHAELGKVPAGDLLRRKKTLPIVYALEQASKEDQSVLHAFYRGEQAPTQEQIKHILSILNRTRCREYCQRALAEQCEQARQTLASLPSVLGSQVAKARANLFALVNYVEEGSWQG